MKRNYHPLVQKTKIELQRLDKIERSTWEEQKKYNSEFLPISVDPKLRPRAFKFMHTLIILLEENGHNIKFYLDRCHIEMYGQLTEINLRQKCFRKRIKESSGYSTDTYEASNKLEFQVGSYARKGWIDKKSISLEDYLPKIYSHIEKDSREMADLRERQRIQKEKDKIQKELDAKIAEQKAKEVIKTEKLFTDSENYKKATDIRVYLKALKANTSLMDKGNNLEIQNYIRWAYKKTDDLDPLVK